MMEQAMMYGVVILIVARVIRQDLKTKTLSKSWLYTHMAIVVFIDILFQRFSNLLSGLLLGGILILFSLATRQMIGLGDALLFTIIGMYFGWVIQLTILFISLFVSGIYSAILLLMKKGTMKSQIAFTPFILIAILCTAIL